MDALNIQDETQTNVLLTLFLKQITTTDTKFGVPRAPTLAVSPLNKPRGAVVFLLALLRGLLFALSSSGMGILGHLHVVRHVSLLEEVLHQREEAAGRQRRHEQGPLEPT